MMSNLQTASTFFDFRRVLAHGYEEDGQGTTKNRTKKATNACTNSTSQGLITTALGVSALGVSALGVSAWVLLPAYIGLSVFA